MVRSDKLFYTAKAAQLAGWQPRKRPQASAITILPAIFGERDAGQQCLPSELNKLYYRHVHDENFHSYSNLIDRS